MGSGKGQSQTSQTQTYTPNAQAGSYITDALNRAQNTANLPFNIPQAPVAGFSQDQSRAFNSVNNAQGMALPYIQQGAGYFNQSAQHPDVASFYNPMAANVTANLNDIFGQQNVQNTGNLVQSAGGVGADRIGVGQANMAKEQGLAAGQTYAGLYQQATQAAQQQQNILQAAGYGYGALGNAAQNSVLQGAQAQLGTGGLQQQLAQAQLNAPYQQQVAQAAFPYQQAQFYGNMVGALAPGLGGTTSGQGTSTPAQPSIWSQLLGAGTAGAGAFGYLSNGGSGYQNGTSNYLGMSDTQQDAWQDAGNYLPSARGGAIPDYDEGGSVSDKPINIASNPYIPQSQMHAIQPHIPQLQQQGGGGGDSGGGIGDILKTGAQIATMFLKSGGTVPHMAGGGTLEDRFAPVQEAIADGTFDREGANTQDNDFAGSPFTNERGMQASIPIPRARPGRMTASAAPPESAMAFAGSPDASPDLPPEITGGNAYAPQRAPAGGGAPSGGASTSPYEIPMTPGGKERQGSFANSPWAALMQAGLGIMSGTSPFAGVNIGHGGMQGLKTLQEQQEGARKDETTAQAAKRLAQEAQFHEDQFNRVTMGQKLAQQQADRPYNELTAAQKEAKARQDKLDDLAEKRFNRPYEELTKAEQAQLDESKRQHDLARVPPGFKTDEQGNLVATPGGPHSPEQIKAEADAKRMPAMNREDMAPMVDAYLTGDHSVMNGVGKGTQGPQNIQQFWNMIAEKLTAQGADGRQIAAAKADFMGQQAALRVAAQRESNIQTAVNEAYFKDPKTGEEKGALPELLRRSAELPRSSFVPWNKALDAYRNNTGSPQQQRYGAAVQAAVTAYSQAMSRTGANSVYAQQHAADILNKFQGQEGLKAAVEQMKIEMEIAKQAPEQTRRATLDHILGKGATEGVTTAPAGAGATAAPALPDQAKAALKEGQITTFGNGQKWKLQNGQPVQVP